MNALNRFLKMASERQDLVFAVFFVLVVAMLILPLPTVLVDALLAINLTLSLIVLITATYLRHALDISTFPSIILVTTIFRVALSVSTTRLILAQGDAGHLVEAFGQFVIAGNIVVGLVVFLVIAIVQFMVITKGAERIAEVSARFTLDAMPGKQMSIDNDLRSGDIDKNEARKRRSTLEKESQFHGAMDGAMRFVKGDAIASLIIVAVNLLGGLTIGMAQRGLSFGEAGRLYVLLSVGDGLIAQIPAMFIAVAAGTIVTRVTTEDSTHLGRDIARQLGAEPKALGISGIVAIMMGFLPGFPTTVFFTLGLMLCGGAFLMIRATKARVLNEQNMALQEANSASLIDEEAAAEAERKASPPLRPFDVGDSLIILGNRNFLEMLRPDAAYVYVAQGREDFQRIMGFEAPPASYRFDANMVPGDVILEVNGIPVKRFFIPDVDPARILTDAQARQYASEISETRMRYVADIFGVAEAMKWLTDIENSVGRLASDVQQLMPFMTIVDSLRRILEDGVGLVPPRLVLEGMVQASQRSQEPDVIAEIVRSYLRRQICFAVSEQDRTINALIVGPDIDAALRQMTGFESEPTANIRADDDLTQSFIDMSKQQAQPFLESGQRVVVMTTADTRRIARKLLWQSGLEIAVLSYSDIAAEYQVRTVGVLSVEDREAA